MDATVGHCDGHSGQLRLDFPGGAAQVPHGLAPAVALLA
jgi:hypothetical protein